MYSTSRTLEAADLGPRFDYATRLFFLFQATRRSGPYASKKGFPVGDRPELITLWVSKAYKPATLPITDIFEEGVTAREWWRSTQPKWRTQDGVLLQDTAVREWAVLTQYSGVGLACALGYLMLRGNALKSLQAEGNITTQAIAEQALWDEELEDYSYVIGALYAIEC